MKKSNKGFTLIELLAVIVVLAVIALIATPIVLRLVDEAREGAAESSATAYVKAVENAILATMVQNTDATFCTEYNAKAETEGETTTYDAKTLVGKTGESCGNLIVEVKGNYPKEAQVFVSNGEVTSAKLVVGDYTINYADGQSKRS